MLIREVPIFVLSHKNSRVLEGGWEGGREGKGRGERGGWEGDGGVGVCVRGVGGCAGVEEGWRGWGADGEREAGDALSMHGSRKK